MKYNRLSDTTLELVEGPRCNSFLAYLEKNAGVQVKQKEQSFWTGDYRAEFDFNGYRFELETLISSPVLSSEGCPKDVFEELLAVIEKY